MTEIGTQVSTDRVLHELVRQLCGTRLSRQELGMVCRAGAAAQPPRPCTERCLESDALEGSCAWLRAAAEGNADSTLLHHGRCERGYVATARPIAVSGRPGSLVSLSRPLPLLPAPLEKATQRLEAASQLVARISQLVEENEGLADEVLRGYEQLNLIFDLTQQVSRITDAAEVERVLLLRIGAVLGASLVGISRPDARIQYYEIATGECISGMRADFVDAALLEQVRRTREGRRVDVTCCGDLQIMTGPLLRLAEVVDVVLAIRRQDAKPFTAGEMLLLESILSFGGQIISNAELHEKLRVMSFEVTRALVAAIDKKDHYTSGHSERVGLLAALTGKELSLSPTDIQTLEWAGLLHDVGKIGVPEEILNKPGKLTDAEFDEIRRHTTMGHEILSPIASFERVLEAVLYHHENPDGSGYPEKLSGEQIPLFARIVHVADAFDALTSNRSYRNAFQHDEAIAILKRDSGTKIDPEVLNAFLRALSGFREGAPDDFAARYPQEQETPLGTP